MAEDNNNNNNGCDYCNYQPCPWARYGRETLEEILAEVRHEVEMGMRPTNNVLRRRTYQLLMRNWQGILGCGNRMRLPECCLIEVRDEFPNNPNNPNATYMGHRDY